MTPQKFLESKSRKIIGLVQTNLSHGDRTIVKTWEPSMKSLGNVLNALASKPKHGKLYVLYMLPQ